MEGEEEDRISLLPDCLLIDIISRLPETKYAIRTGTLSKRWQHLWYQLPNLIICHQAYNNTQFYTSVERIISQLNLNKFQLYANCNRETKPQVNNCIRDVINHNVQQVDFHLSCHPCSIFDNGFHLPEFFFTGSSFIHLTLRNCTFKQADVISWENLRTLHIQYADLDEDLIENILSGSPLLETFMLDGCEGFELLDITNKSVKNLVFSGYTHAMYPYCVEINAPYTLSLTIQDGLILDKLLLLNVSSVIKAELNCYADIGGEEKDEVNEEMLKGLLLGLGHVKEVKIGDYCLEALARLKDKGFIYPSNLKVLQEIDSN